MDPRNAARGATSWLATQARRLIYDDSAVLDALSIRLTSGARRKAPTPSPVDAYCVYRARNAGTVSGLVAALPPGSRVHLHALDETAPELADLTRSSGPGLRSQLHQRLIDAFPGRPGNDLILFDDDVEFAGSSPTEFLGLVHQFGLDVAQPAHARGSNTSHDFNRMKRFTIARETNFVETGPLVVFSPHAQTKLFPIPGDIQMGYGLDVWWSLRREPDALRLGIVDATPINHTGAVRADYNADEEWRVLEEYLAKRGWTDLWASFEEPGRKWWVARPCPPVGPRRPGAVS